MARTTVLENTKQMAPQRSKLDSFAMALKKMSEATGPTYTLSQFGKDFAPVQQLGGSNLPTLGQTNWNELAMKKGYANPLSPMGRRDFSVVNSYNQGGTR